MLQKALLVFAVTLIIYVFFYIIFPDQIMEMHYETGPVILFVAFDLIALNASSWLILSFNKWFFTILDKKFTWERKPFIRLILQVKGTSIAGFFIVLFFMGINALVSAALYPQLIELVKEEEWKNLAERSLYFFGAVSILYHAVYISYHFYNKWKKALVESEKLKTENLHAQLHTLQSQTNPHFLFNSLNTLTSIIDEDKKTAIEFVQRLSNFYRYLLQRQTDHVVLLKDELAFVDSYIYLQKKRFGNNFNVDIGSNIYELNKYIPTFALQIVLENTVKHNIVSSEKPLYVKIFVQEEDTLVVENNLQRKSFVESSTEHGLENIKNRYEILSKENIHIFKTENIFRVTLPLMNERGLYESSDN